MTNTNIVTDGLDAERIASLVRESNPVCLLPWRNEGNAARNDCTLYVYQTHGMDEGRNTTKQDVERLLFESAPIRARRDVPGVAV